MELVGTDHLERREKLPRKNFFFTYANTTFRVCAQDEETATLQLKRHLHEQSWDRYGKNRETIADHITRISSSLGIMDPTDNPNCYVDPSDHEYLPRPESVEMMSMVTGQPTGNFNTVEHEPNLHTECLGQIALFETESYAQEQQIIL